MTWRSFQMSTDRYHGQPGSGSSGGGVTGGAMSYNSGMPPQSPRMPGHGGIAQNLYQGPNAGPPPPPPGNPNYAGFNHHSSYVGPNYNMMPPPSGFPSGKPQMMTAPNSPVGAQAAAQAAVAAAANSATHRSSLPHSSVYSKQHMPPKMYPGPGGMPPQHHMMGPPTSLQQQQHGRPGEQMPPPLGPTGAMEPSPQMGPTNNSASMSSNDPSLNNSSGASTLVTQSITSPLPAAATLSMDSKAGQQQANIGNGPQPPPILDEASQASTSSSQPEESLDAPTSKQNSKGLMMSHPPTPNTLGSPSAASMSSFHDEFESVSSPSCPRTPASPAVNNQGYDHGHNAKVNKRPDGLLKLYELSDDPDRRNFLDKLIAFNEERGVTLTTCPTISKQLIDLYKLYMLVKERGGFSDVTRQKLWKECAQICNIAMSSSAAYTLRKQYIKHLLPFECKYDRGGIDHQLVISQTENSNRKKGKGVASPGPGDSSSQGSYPLSGTPGVMEGPYPPQPPPSQGIPPGSNFPPNMSNYPHPGPPPPGSHEYPHHQQGHFPHQQLGHSGHPPSSAVPPHSAQMLPASVPNQNASNRSESISAQDPFSDEIQSSSYSHQRHPSGPSQQPQQSQTPGSLSSSSTPGGQPSISHPNFSNFNTPNYPSSTTGPSGYYNTPAVASSHEQYNTESGPNSEYSASRQGVQTQIPSGVSQDSYANSASTGSYSSRNIPPVSGTSPIPGQPYYGYNSEYNRDMRNYEQRYPPLSQPPPTSSQQSQSPISSVASQVPSTHPSSSYNNYRPTHAPSTPGPSESCGSDSSTEYPRQATQRATTPTSGGAPLTPTSQQTPQPQPSRSPQTSQQSEPFESAPTSTSSSLPSSVATSSAGFMPGRGTTPSPASSTAPSGQPYYQQNYDYNRENRSYEHHNRTHENIYNSNPATNVAQRSQFYPPVSTQQSHHPQASVNSTNYPPRSPVSSQASNYPGVVNQQSNSSDNYRNSDVYQQPNTMNRTQSALAQRLLAARLTKPPNTQTQSGGYSNAGSNIYPNTNTAIGKMVPPPAGHSSAPSPPGTNRDSAMYANQANVYSKRHPDFIKQDQQQQQQQQQPPQQPPQSYPTNSYSHPQSPASQYPAFGNRGPPPTAASAPNSSTSQMYHMSREGGPAYRYGHPSAAPPLQYGPHAQPNSRESWETMGVRPEGAWNSGPINRYGNSGPPQSYGGSNAEYFMNSYGGTTSHPMNKVPYGPRGDPRMFHPSQMSAANSMVNRSHLPPHMMTPNNVANVSMNYSNSNASNLHHHLSMQQPVKKEIVFPPDSTEATQPNLVKRRRLTAKDLTQVEAWRLLMCLKSGLLAESSWALDVLTILLHDDNTILYFGLQHLPGLLDVLLEHYKKYLSECFEDLFKSSNDEMDASEFEYLEKLNTLLPSLDLSDTSKRDLKWYELEKDLKFNEKLNNLLKNTSVSRSNKKNGLNNIPTDESDEKIVLLNTNNFTYKSRTGKSVKVKNSRSIFLMDRDNKLWDAMLEDKWNQEKLKKEKENWSKCFLECTSHIQTHFQPKEKFLRFVKVIKNEKKNKLCDENDNHDDCNNIDNVDETCNEVNKSCNDIDDVNGDNENMDIEMKSKRKSSDSNNNNSNKVNGVENHSSPNSSVSDVPSNEDLNGVNEQQQKQKDEYPKIRENGLKRKSFDEFEEEAYSRDDPPLSAIDDYSDSLAKRCLCLSTMIRNLSFVPGNDVEMSKNSKLLLILGHLLLLNHTHSEKKRNFDKFNNINASATCDDLLNSLNSTAEKVEDKIDSNNNNNEQEWWWDTLHLIRENTLVTLANISGQLDLSPYSEEISLPILDGLLHWTVCPSSYAVDNLPTTSLLCLTPQRLSLEALVKLSILESNVDLILATPPWDRMMRLYKMLAKLLNRNEDQTLREFSLVLLSNFASADASIARAVALTGTVVPQLISFVEQFEQSALSVANSQGLNALRENPELMGTTLDMVRRAASCLRCLARVTENRSLFVSFQQRLLALVMSQILDQGVASIIADVIYECSLYESDLVKSKKLTEDKYSLRKLKSNSNNTSTESTNNDNSTEIEQKSAEESIPNTVDEKAQSPNSQTTITAEAPPPSSSSSTAAMTVPQITVTSVTTNDKCKVENMNEINKLDIIVNKDIATA